MSLILELKIVNSIYFHFISYFYLFYFLNLGLEFSVMSHDHISHKTW